LYPIADYKEADTDAVLRFMRTYPFVTLVGTDASGSAVATHVPLLVKTQDRRFYFEGHVMRKTEHANAFEKNNDVLVVFTGPQCYVSAGWYGNPLSGSTWNYMAVHAKGTLRVLEPPDLLRILEEITSLFENNPSSPASFDKLPNEYVSGMAKAIFAFRIDVTSWDSVFKLSQDRNETDRRNVIEQLRKRGSGEDALVAEEMEKRSR